MRVFLPTGATLVSPARRRSLLAEVQGQFTLEPTSAAVTSGELAGYYIVTGSDLTLVNNVVAAPSMRLVGTPNNGLCEENEPSESTDCITPVACPDPTPSDGTWIGRSSMACSGNGVCKIASGTCVCSAGYTGSACDRCNVTGGFVDIPLGTATVCSKLQSDFAPEPLPSPPPSPAIVVSTTKEGKGVPVGVIAGAAVGGVAGVAAVSGAAYYFLKVRGAKNVAPS